MNIRRTIVAWLLPIVLVLFIAQVVTFTFAMSLTLADRSKAPDHYLTYKTGSLTWSQVEGIDQNGVAELSVFSAVYPETVISEDGRKVFAPGTEGTNTIRLRNTTANTIKYTAVMYEIRSTDTLPVFVDFADGKFVPTEDYTLPKGVTKDKVIKAVTGQVEGSRVCDFDVTWRWIYEINDEKDIIDTSFGDKAAFDEPDTLTVGFSIIVEDDELHVPAKTGGESKLREYGIFLLITGAVLVFLAVTRNVDKKQHKKEQESK